ncbi:MAG: hypothetical protein GZ087_05785 [Flavobacterium sp.]|nr:hypothetical protein [Flavobacterium sp.]
MNIAELKLEIIAKIIATDDVILLNKIKEVINDYDSNLIANEPPAIYERIRVFSTEEKRKINLALQQVENGECISDEEAQKEIQELLEEVHIFTPEQRKRILNSLEQSKTGNIMTDEEAEIDIQKWL